MLSIILLISFIINGFIYIAMAILFFTPHYLYAIMLLLAGSLLFLILTTSFYQYTNKIMDKNAKMLAFLKLDLVIKKLDNIDTIDFKKVDGKWYSVDDKSIVLDLDTYLLEKSFILSWISRAVRYPYIHDRQKLINILKLKLDLSTGKHRNDLRVRFIYDNKIKEYYVVKNNISKMSILSRYITKSKFYICFISNISYKRMIEVGKINEKLYLSRKSS